MIIQVTDTAGANAVLKGSVTIEVTDTSGANAVVAGLFFDPVPSASYVGTDKSTQGAWTVTDSSGGNAVVSGIF